MELLQNSGQTQQAEATAPQLDPQTTPQDTTPNLQTMTAQQLVDQLALLLQQEELPDRKTVEQIRGQFIRRKERQNEADANQRDNLEAQEIRLGELLATFKERDRKRQEAQEALFSENKAKKEALLLRFEELFNENKEGTEFGELYAKFTHIRDEWKESGSVDQKDQAELNKRFYTLRDQFYDLKAINDDLRQLDFKKNLEAKRALLQELRDLEAVKDVIAAHRKLQELTTQWHELGPVSKELRQEVNTEFKQLAGALHKRHQEFHDKRKATEEENLQAKTDICVKVEELLIDGVLTTHAAWSKATDQIKAMQAEWRTIGYAPRKDNDMIYQRFRAGVDAFFRHRSDFMRKAQDHSDEVLKGKRELIERARALRESTDWETTAEAFKKLQKEWQEAGSVSQKYSQKIWEEFRESFDYFFERRKKEGTRKSDVYHEARKSLAIKREILKELTAINEGEEPENLRELLTEYNERWKQAGSVPHKEKEAINAAYRELLDALHGKLRKHRSERRLSGYGTSLDNLETKGSSLQTEHARLQRHLDRQRAELNTYENNLTFLNVSSKSGSTLLSEIERKRDALVADIELTEKKLRLLEQKEREAVPEGE